MSKIIYHMGTGTYFGLDDDVVVIDLDLIPKTVDAEVMDNEGDDIAAVWGVPFDHAFTSSSECITINPRAIRSEAAAFIDVFGDALPEEVPAFEWALNASDEELETIAAEVLNYDYLWGEFVDDVRNAIRDAWATKEDSK